MKTFLGLSAATAALLAMMSGTSSAGVILTYDSTFGSTENTGASATVDFSFATVDSDTVMATLNTTNTTSTTSAPFASTLTAFGFDLPDGVSFESADFSMSGSYFGEIIENASLPPYDTVEIGISNDNNFLGGSPSGGLEAGESTTVKLNFMTTLSLMDLNDAFESGFTEGTLTAFARFQEVGADGEGSDKVLGGITPNPDEPAPGVVPEPASLAVWGLAAGLGVCCMARRRRTEKNA